MGRKVIRRIASAGACLANVMLGGRAEAQVRGPDFGFEGITQNGGEANDPPDPEIAVGPADLVLATNSEIGVFGKEGEPRGSSTLRGFWTPVGAQYKVFDPICLYDDASGRFVIAANEVGFELPQNYLLVAVSDDTEAAGTWYKHRFQLTVPEPVDFPSLGIDASAVYVSINVGRTGRRVYIMDKASLLAGAVPSFASVSLPMSPMGVGACDSRDAAEGGYFVRVGGQSDEYLRLYSIRDALTDPRVVGVDVAVPGFSPAPPAPQRGTEGLIESGGSPLGLTPKNSVYRNGSLWTAHMTSPDGVSAGRVRWYEIAMNGWPESGEQPVLAQSGEITQGTGEEALHTYFPDIHVDEAGHGYVIFSASSTRSYPFLARAMRRSDDPAGFMREPVVLQVSDGPKPENVPGEPTPYGDYNSVEEDPVEPGVMWSHGEYYSVAERRWKTWVSRMDLSRGLVLEVLPGGGALRPGGAAVMRVSSAGPGKMLFVYYTQSGKGSTPVPELKVTLDLDGAVLLGSFLLSPKGSGSVTVRLPKSLVAGEIRFQAAEKGSTSNVVVGVVE